MNDSKTNMSNSIALAVTTMIFFMWGFITELNDVLIPHLKSVFDLSYWQAMQVQFCFFTAYLVMAIPAGRIVARVGYKLGIVYGLIVAGAGALLILPAAQMGAYALFLPALFVLASGIVMLQCSANPYVSLLGVPERAASRLNFAQAINSIGHTIGPAVGGALIFGATALSVSELEALPAVQRAQTVQPLYLGVALALIVLAVVIFLFRLPEHAEATERRNDQVRYADVWKLKRVQFGVLAIFLYVGAEVAIGSFVANFAMRPDIGAISLSDVSHYVSAYWFGAMIGRLVGAGLLLKIKPQKLLSLYAVCNILLLLAAMLGSGRQALYCVLAIGFFNSIMFPTIFTMVIEGLGPLTQKAASLLVMAIFGGAVIPLLQGKLVDWLLLANHDETSALQWAFVLPMLCYGYIVWFGRRTTKMTEDAPADSSIQVQKA